MWSYKGVQDRYFFLDLGHLDLKEDAKGKFRPHQSGHLKEVVVPTPP